MKTRRNYTLTNEELLVVQAAIGHDKRPEVRQKAQAIHLLHLGHRPTEVAAMMAVDRTTIYDWHEAWVVGGIDGLVRREGSGRRCKATPEYEQLLQEALETAPAELGYAFALWTLDRLRQHLFQKTGILLSARTLGNTLKRLDYVYRRPKHDFKHLHDPQVMAQATAHLEELKKKPGKVPSSSSLWMKPR